MIKNKFIGLIAVVVVILLVVIGFQFFNRDNLNKVGVILSLTGPASFFGQEMKNGMELANKDAKIDFLYEDSAGDVKTGISAYRKLKDVNNIKSVIVAISSVAGGVIPVAEQDKLPIIQTLVSAQKISNSQYSFRFFTSAEQEAPIMAKYANDSLKLKNVAILNVSDDYGKTYANVFKDSFEKLGGNVSVVESFDKKDQDVKTQLLKIKAANPDGVYVVGLDPHLAVIFKQANELGLKAIMMTNWVMASPAVQKKVGSYSEGVYMTTPMYYIEDSVLVSEFTKNYKQLYNSEPSAYAAIGYDLVMIMKKAQLENNNNLLASLKNVKNVDGLMGTLSADDEGEITFPLYPAKIQDGKLILVK